MAVLRTVNQGTKFFFLLGKFFCYFFIFCLCYVMSYVRSVLPLLNAISPEAQVSF